MELTHRFTVPGTVEETWARFQDIGSLAECFPGAQVTSVEGDTFEGTVKVKLGPIALVYAGSGSFVSQDEAAHRFVVEAKGRDKRGNGTAGATVTVQLEGSSGGASGGASTEVEVQTDLSITGKPAQFGRGVMQDVSDKLLGQFVACLEQRSTEAAPAPAGVAPEAGAADAAAPAEAAPQPVSREAAAAPTHRAGADSIDLGGAVLPVLARRYGPAAAGLLGVLVLLWLVLRRRSHEPRRA